MPLSAEVSDIIGRIRAKFLVAQHTVPVGTLFESTHGGPPIFEQSKKVLTDWLLNPQTTDPAQLDKGRVRDRVQQCQATGMILMADQESLRFSTKDQGFFDYRGTPEDLQVLAAQHAIADAILDVNPQQQWGFYGSAAPITGESWAFNTAAWEASEKMLPLFAAVQRKTTHLAGTGYWNSNSLWWTWITGLMDVGQVLSYRKPLLFYVSPWCADRNEGVLVPDLIFRQILLLTKRLGISCCVWGNAGTDPNAGVPLDRGGSWVGIVNEIFSAVN